jgi:hypothetical protein
MSVPRNVLVSALAEIRAQVECIEYYLGGVRYLPECAPKKQTLEESLAEARAAVVTAKKELHDAEVRVMRADETLVNARTNLKTVVQVINAVDPAKTEVPVPPSDSEKAAFKAMTDAIQTIQMYAIRNGKSLGPTMDALTERLFRVEA